jgi:Mrp family chromosome partitioning ATPase
LRAVNKSRNARLQKPARQPVQLPQPRSVEHRNRTLHATDAEHVRRISTDGARRAIRQLNHQQQRAIPSLKRPRRQQTPEQWMRLRDNPHFARQHRAQLLQSVAVTPGTGKTHLAVGLARAAAHAGYRTYFTTAADLAARCHRAAIEGRWATTMRFYAGPTLLAI